MNMARDDTAGRLLRGAAGLIVRGGYNGFSYADLARQIGIRKASIHHHFPSKVDLVLKIVALDRDAIRAQIASLEGGDPPNAMEQLLAYTRHWERCIIDQDVPFCLVAVLAAELPALPHSVAEAVRGHFRDLADWLEQLLELGKRQGAITLTASSAVEADRFMASVHGAMLSARAMDDPFRFRSIVEASLARICH